MIDIDADLQDADWPKRTPDKFADLADGAQSRAAAKPALALLGPDATEDELASFVEALTGVPQDRSVPPWWERLTIVRHLPGQHDQKSHAGGGGGAPGAGGGTGTKDDPIRTSDVETAQKALAEGKYVELSSERQVSTLVDRLAADINDARARGETRDYDLCKVSVPKTNLFCSQNVGIPRAQMPQLKGRPIPGSPADALPKNPKGEADISAGFVDYLKASQGIGVSESVIDAKYLKASQNQLDGVKVVGMAQAMREGKIPAESIFVTRDDYIVDGHHRWAANVANEYKQGRAIAMPVRVIDTDIITVLSLANQYAADMGLPTQAYGQRSVVRAGCTDCGTSTLVLGLPEARHLAGQHDQQSHAGGGGLAAPTSLVDFNEAGQAAILGRANAIADAAPGFPRSSEAMADETIRVLERATPDQIERGKRWYQDASDETRRMAAATDPPTEFETACGVVARCSPGREWEANIEVARRVVKVHSEDEPFEIDEETYGKLREKPDRGPGMYRPSELTGEQVAFAHPEFSDVTLGKTYEHVPQVADSFRLMRGETTPDALLGGPKIRNFYNNVHNPADPLSVTIDSWQVRAMTPGGLALPKKTREGMTSVDSSKVDVTYYTSSPSSVKGGIKQGTGMYPMFADAMQIAARRVGLTPQQVQAITWIVVREGGDD